MRSATPIVVADPALDALLGLLPEDDNTEAAGRSDHPSSTQPVGV